MPTEITDEIATKIRNLVSKGLVAGSGKPEPGKMDLEGVVCYVLGLELSSHASDYVATSLRHVLIDLNDADWPSDKKRAYGLRKLALLQLGSAGVMDEDTFTRRVVLVFIRTIIPTVFRNVAKRVPKRARELRNYASLCEKTENVSLAIEETVAHAVVCLNYLEQTYDFDEDYIRSASASVQSCLKCLRQYNFLLGKRSSAFFQKDKIKEHIASYAAGCVRSIIEMQDDKRLLLKFSNTLAQILIDMNVPGTKWLYLLENPKQSPK